MLEKLRGKRLLILGGISSMVEVVERAHELGVVVYVTDYLLDSPAKRIADKAFMISVTDVDAVVDLIKKENIDGVYTGNIDLVLPYYAMICDKAHLPCYGTLKNFHSTMNKTCFKKMCRNYNIPVVPEFTEDLIRKGEVEFPVIVKPSDSSGGCGISVCWDMQQLHSGIKKALQFSKCRKYIVEKFMQGNDVQIYYYFQDGDPIFVTMCDRYLFKQNTLATPLPLAYIFPSVYTTNFINNVNNLYCEMFKKEKFGNGTLFLQAVVENGVPYVYETGYRTGGNREQYLISETCGIFSVDMLICYALTGQESEEKLSVNIDPFLHGKVACKLSNILRPGRVSKIEGLEQVNRHYGVVTTILNNFVGDVIENEKIGTLQQLGYRSFLVGNDMNALGRCINYVQDTLRFVDEKGDDMSVARFDISNLDRYL